MRESKVIELHKENVNYHLNFTYFNNRLCTPFKITFCVIFELYC